MAPPLHFILNFPYTQDVPTLSQATSKTKFIIKWGGIAIVILFFVLIARRVSTIIKEKTAPPPPPTVAFGKLPPIGFPESATDRKLTYAIDTLTGLLPDFPREVKVYRIKSFKPDLLALARMQDKVARIGFNSLGTALSEKSYQWKTDVLIQKTLTANIFSSNFTLISSLEDQKIQSINDNFSKENAINTAADFLSKMSSFSSDFDLAKTKVSKISDDKFMRVDFFQKDIDDLPIYYSKPQTSTINLLIGNLGDQPSVIGANFFHQNISDDSATYPIKSADETLTQLKEKKAYIATYSDNNSNIVIKNVSLGYYLSQQEQDYLLPIVVFEGDNGFFAYVPAVRDEWVGK